jgi:hypothetical protein
MAGNREKGFDVKGVAEALSDTFDARGFVASFRSAFDATGAGRSFVLGFKHGADLLLSQIRGIEPFCFSLLSLAGTEIIFRRVFHRRSTPAKYNFGSAARIGASGRPSSRRTMLVPWTKETHL